MKTCPESRTGHRTPDCMSHHPLMRTDPSKTLGTDLVHREVLLPYRFKIPSLISQDWRKSPAQLSEGNAAPDHYAVASCTTCFCTPREVAEQAAGSHRLQSELSFLIFSVSAVPWKRVRPNTAYSAEKVQLLLRKMFLEVQSQLNLHSNSFVYIHTDTQTLQLLLLNWWQIIPQEDR